MGSGDDFRFAIKHGCVNRSKGHGRAGMGEVYAAQDLELGGRVALKTIHADRLNHKDSTARFRREIQLARQVTHPNVCRVFDVGHDTLGGRELVFFTMEFLPGQTLAKFLASRGALPPGEALGLARQLADGLGALHERGIVHRDLEPANAFIVGDEGAPRLVLLDFGLARGADNSDDYMALTRPHTVMGTPPYMAPEQLLGERSSVATDIYAFGLLLFEIATGKRLSDLVTGGPMARVRGDVSIPQNTQLPSQWTTAVHRCLSRNPGERPTSTAAVIALLESTNSIPASKKSEAVPVRKFPWRLSLAIVGFLLLAAVAGWMAIHGNTTASAKPVAMQMSVRDLLLRQDRLGNLEKAVAQLQKELAAGPGSQAALIHYELGWASYMKYGQTRDKADMEKALAECLEAVRIDPDLTEAHGRLSRIYDVTGRPDLAEQEAKAALKLDPRNALAWSATGLIYARAGRNQDAEEALRKAVDLAPDDWRQHDTLGNFLRVEGRFDDARKELEEAVRLTADNVLALADLARVAMRQSRYAEAQSIYEKTVAIVPGFDAWTGLGTALMLQRQYSKAVDAFGHATAGNPNNYLGWANLASAASWSPEHRAEAKEAYRKAIVAAERQRALTPNSADFGSTGLKLVWAAPLNPGDIEVHWEAVDAQARIRQYLAVAMASAFRAAQKISMATTNPWGAAKAAYELASSIGRLLDGLEDQVK